jgi:GT2 family glycosyltransferase
MILAIIIPVYNHLDYTKKTLHELTDHVKQIKGCIFHIILVDDGSSDGTSDWVSLNYPEVHVLKGDGNLWWSGGVNMGARYALENLHADYILLWNNDISFEDRYFNNLIRILDKADSETIIGSKILVAGKTDVIWSMGGYFNRFSGRYGMHAYFEPNADKYEVATEVDWLTGMGTIVPRSIIERIGYWDKENFPQYHGDSDFTYRAKLKGFRVIVHPELRLFNSVENSGMTHPESFKQLVRLLTDNRSKSNFNRNYIFYKRYATSYRAIAYLYWRYVGIIGGFFKWKVFGLLGIRKKTI